MRAGNPAEVDLSALCDECNVFDRCLLGHAKGVCHSPGPSLRRRRPADAQLSPSAVLPSLPARVSHVDAPRCHLFLFDKRRERFVPAVELCSRLQGRKPDVTAAVSRPDDESGEVFVLVDGSFLQG